MEVVARGSHAFLCCGEEQREKKRRIGINLMIA